jgi:uncharacterized protein YdbL (DUF1318 family)
MNIKVEMIIAASLLAVTASTAVYAQRDPAYQSAREGGLIGEKTDGYLGFVSAPSPAIKALVDDLNIKRKAAYTKEAAANGATVEEMALRNGCRLISERTVAGEKYQLPGGAWATRTAAAPTLDPRCPT